jgi:hypothetical protein
MTWQGGLQCQGLIRFMKRHSSLSSLLFTLLCKATDPTRVKVSGTMSEDAVGAEVERRWKV